VREASLWVPNQLSFKGTARIRPKTADIEFYRYGRPEAFGTGYRSDDGAERGMVTSLL
jgi:hypothetical protein